MVLQTLSEDFLQLQPGFSAVREKHVARTVAAGLQDSSIQVYHTQFRYLLGAFTHDHKTLEDFKTNVWKLLVTIRPGRGGVEAGVAVEATCFTGTDKQATTFSISRLITDASLVLFSHDPAAQGACNFTDCNAPLIAAR